VPSIWATLRAQFQPQPGTARPVVGDVPSVYSAADPTHAAQAVASALQSNPGLIGQSLEPSRSNRPFSPHRPSSIPSPVLKAPSTDWCSRRERCSRERSLHHAQRRLELLLSKRLVTGAQFRIDWLNNRFNTDSQFQGLAPQYQPQALISLNQLSVARFRPLLPRACRSGSPRPRRMQPSQRIAPTRPPSSDKSCRAIGGSSLRGRLEGPRELARPGPPDGARQPYPRRRRGAAPGVGEGERSGAARREEEVIVGTNLRDQARRSLRQIVYFEAGPGRSTPGGAGRSAVGRQGARRLRERAADGDGQPAGDRSRTAERAAAAS